jgi:4-hydroxy-3-methylbut-2-enyl diphosphate reductase IspH
MTDDCKIEFSTHGSFDHISVEVRGEDEDGYKTTTQTTMSVNKLLQIVAEIIDKEPYYKDIFDKRLF